MQSTDNTDGYWSYISVLILVPIILHLYTYTFFNWKFTIIM